MPQLKTIGFWEGASLILGLIGWGIQTRFPEQKWIGTWVLVLAGLMAFGFLVWGIAQYFAVREYKRAHVTPPLTPPVTDQHLTQTANPHSEVKVEVNPVFHGQSQSESQSPPVPATHVAPELECSDWYIVSSLLGDWGVLGDVGSFIRVAQADFHLKPIVDSPEWIELRTQLVFYADDENSTRLRRVKDGVWREHGKHVQMPLRRSDTRSLVIALCKGGFQTYEYRTRQTHSGLTITHLTPEQFSLDAKTVIVHVRLVGEYLSQVRLDQETWFKLSSEPNFTIEQIRPLSNSYIQGSA